MAMYPYTLYLFLTCSFNSQYHYFKVNGNPLKGSNYAAFFFSFTAHLNLEGLHKQDITGHNSCIPKGMAVKKVEV